MTVERPVGQPVSRKPTGAKPDLRVLEGAYIRLEPVGQQHAQALFKHADGHTDLWTYMPYGPFEHLNAFSTWLKDREAARDPWFYAYVKNDEAVGMGAFMRLDAVNGVIEIGHIWMTPVLQRTTESTEAIFLMMKHCFDDLGARRLEWKCDDLNAPSRAAAQRFGFRYEGTFRQHLIVKGRNRDTAWYAIIDKDWPAIKSAFETWLSPANFDAAGQQKAKLQLR